MQRGHQPSTVKQQIMEAELQILQKRRNNKNNVNIDTCCFLHLPCNKYDINQRRIQKIFKDTLQNPPKLQPLHQLRNIHNEPLQIQRLVVAYHRPHNIRNLLFSRRLKPPICAEIDTFFNNKKSTEQE